VSTVMCSGGQRLVALDEPTPEKTIALDHLVLLLSVDFSQWLFGRLGLYIPLPLTHLRLMDCVEVQRIVRHIQDHIQAIQVLIFSSIDLHMLCVCA
jgi:hypothetical protein